MPGEGDQSKHAPPVSPEIKAEPRIRDSEVRAQMLLAYANRIQRDKKIDFRRAWILASEQHPELIGSSDGMRKLAPLPGTDSSVATASYTEIGFIK